MCVPCRNVSKYPDVDKSREGNFLQCRFCKGPLTSMYKWSAPKKNNERAWKRIENGDWYWNRRKRRPREDTSVQKKGHKILRRARTGNYVNGIIDLGAS